MDFSSLWLDGETTCLTLITAKQFGITGAAVQAGEREAKKRLNERAHNSWQALRRYDPELRFSDQLAKEDGNPYSLDYWDVHIAVILTDAQRKAIADFCRQTFLSFYDDAKKSDEELRKRYPKMFRFLTDVHRLCELLAADPIEVSAGPQEERQQTTADVIDEVERQLTQLGTGEAFCALLQADHALSAAKTKLLPAPAAAAGDSAVIEGIRARSRKRFSRSRAEVDARTRRRRAIGTPGAQAAPPARQATTAPPPSQARQPPQPEPPGEPPIGRR